MQALRRQRHEGVSALLIDLVARKRPVLLAPSCRWQEQQQQHELLTMCSLALSLLEQQQPPPVDSVEAHAAVAKLLCDLAAAHEKAPAFGVAAIQCGALEFCCAAAMAAASVAFDKQGGCQLPLMTSLLTRCIEALASLASNAHFVVKQVLVVDCQIVSLLRATTSAAVSACVESAQEATTQLIVQICRLIGNCSYGTDVNGALAFKQQLLAAAPEVVGFVVAQLRDHEAASGRLLRQRWAFHALSSLCYGGPWPNATQRHLLPSLQTAVQALLAPALAEHGAQPQRRSEAAAAAAAEAAEHSETRARQLDAFYFAGCECVANLVFRWPEAQQALISLGLLPPAMWKATPAARTGVLCFLCCAVGANVCGRDFVAVVAEDVAANPQPASLKYAVWRQKFLTAFGK